MRPDGGVADGPTLLLILMAAQNAGQLRSRLERILNIPQRVRLRCVRRLGLAGQRFEQPSGIYDSNRGVSEGIEIA